MKRPPWGRSCMMPNYDIAELCHGCLKLPILRAALRSSGVSFPLPASGPADSVQEEANAVSRPQCPANREPTTSTQCRQYVNLDCSRVDDHALTVEFVQPFSLSLISKRMEGTGDASSNP